MMEKLRWWKYLVYRWWHDKLPIFVVWHLLPKRIVYWAAIRVGANATTGEFSNQVVPELYFMDALKRWDEPDDFKAGFEFRVGQADGKV